MTDSQYHYNICRPTYLIMCLHCSWYTYNTWDFCFIYFRRTS